MANSRYEELTVEKVVRHSKQRDQNEQKHRGTRKLPVLGETRPNSALQGHWVRSRAQKMD